MSHPIISLDRYVAAIFDADGVITDSARVHAAAWKTVFDPFLRARAATGEGEFSPFDVGADYLRHVDGKPRMNGAREFLASRGIVLADGPNGTPHPSLVDLADRKDAVFLDQVRHYGVAPYPETVAFVRELRRRGGRAAAVSASRNCAEVLKRAGVSGMFDARVDGVDAARLGLPGTRDPGLLTEAARRLEAPTERVVVVRDTPAGVEAGRRGGFGLIVGLDRDGHPAEFAEHGADLVVPDLGEITLTGRTRESLSRT